MLYIKCITKIDGTTTYDAEDLDLVMAIYNLIEYSSNCSEKTGSLWFYYKDETNNFNAEIDNTNNFNSFECKTKLLENTKTDGANGIFKSATIIVLLRFSHNFWRSLEMLLFSCKVEL